MPGSILDVTGNKATILVQPYGSTYQHRVTLEITSYGDVAVLDEECLQSTEDMNIYHPHASVDGLCIDDRVTSQAARFFKAGDYVTGLTLIIEALSYITEAYEAACHKCYRTFNPITGHCNCDE